MASPPHCGDAAMATALPDRPLVFGSAQQPAAAAARDKASSPAIGEYRPTPVGPNPALVESSESAKLGQGALGPPLLAGTGPSCASVASNREPVSLPRYTATAVSEASSTLIPPPHRPSTFSPVPTPSRPEASKNQDTNSQLPGDSLMGRLEGPQPTTAPQQLSTELEIEHGYDEVDGHRILRLKPTLSQWQDFPSILAYARTLGVQGDGCFKVSIPEGLHDPLPEKAPKKVPANAYKVKQIRKTAFWQVSTVPADGEFSWSAAGPEFSESVQVAFKNLKKLFRSNMDRQMRNVRYRVDVPAWTARQRLEAGVPERSPIHPLKGDKLDDTKAIIPGIHTPYVYESGRHFGATFQIHAEDFRLASLNHLYRGRKIWVVVPATAVDTAEKALSRGAGCSQFMRHRAEFFFPDKLDKLGIPYRLVDQRPGETIVILPDAYHEGFSTGYTIAEARNYADDSWNTGSYQPCQESCRLATAIPAAFMRKLGEGEERLDLCAAYGDDGRLAPLEALQKRPLLDRLEECQDVPGERSSDLARQPMEERDVKRIKA